MKCQSVGGGTGSRLPPSEDFAVGLVAAACLFACAVVLVERADADFAEAAGMCGMAGAVNVRMCGRGDAVLFHGRVCRVCCCCLCSRPEPPEFGLSSHRLLNTSAVLKSVKFPQIRLWKT